MKSSLWVQSLRVEGSATHMHPADKHGGRRPPKHPCAQPAHVRRGPGQRGAYATVQGVPWRLLAVSPGTECAGKEVSGAEGPWVCASEAPGPPRVEPHPLSAGTLGVRVRSPCRSLWVQVASLWGRPVAALAARGPAPGLWGRCAFPWGATAAGSVAHPAFRRLGEAPLGLDSFHGAFQALREGDVCEMCLGHHTFYCYSWKIGFHSPPLPSSSSSHPTHHHHHHHHIITTLSPSSHCHHRHHRHHIITIVTIVTTHSPVDLTAGRDCAPTVQHFQNQGGLWSPRGG